jgi:hypothetical protein
MWAYGFTTNRQFAEKKLPETPYFLVVTPIFWVGYSEWYYIWFYGFYKIHIFAENL